MREATFANRHLDRDDFYVGAPSQYAASIRAAPVGYRWRETVEQSSTAAGPWSRRRRGTGTVPSGPGQLNHAHLHRPLLALASSASTRRASEQELIVGTTACPVEGRPRRRRRPLPARRAPLHRREAQRGRPGSGRNRRDWDTTMVRQTAAERQSSIWPAAPDHGLRWRWLMTLTDGESGSVQDLHRRMFRRRPWSTLMFGSALGRGGANRREMAEDAESSAALRRARLQVLDNEGDSSLRHGSTPWRFRRRQSSTQTWQDFRSNRPRCMSRLSRLPEAIAVWARAIPQHSACR